MSVESDFVYMSEKSVKDGHDYEISLLSPDDLEIIRPRCDIPSPLQCSLEEGVTRQLPNSVSEINVNKSQSAVRSSTSCEQVTSKESVLENVSMTQEFDCQVSEGQMEIGKAVRPLPSYGFATRRKGSDLRTCTNSQEALGLSLVETTLTNTSPVSDANPVNFKDRVNIEKATDSHDSRDLSTKSVHSSRRHQNALVIVTPPGFKVGAESLPAVKSSVGPHSTILCNANSSRDSSGICRGTINAPSLRTGTSVYSVPTAYSKIEPLYTRTSQSDDRVILLDSKYTSEDNNELENDTAGVDSERLNTSFESKLDRSNFVKDSDTNQGGILWKSSVLFSRSTSGNSDCEGGSKASSSTPTFEGRDISSLSPSGCYGVNLVIEDNGENVAHFQASECPQHNVTILEGYDQPLAVSGGLLNNSTVPEQAFLQVTSMNSESDNSSSDRLPGEVVITQHILSLPQLYSCHWEGCNTHLLTIEDLISHAVSAHVKPGKDQQYCCHWQGCQRDGRTFNARYKMLIHLRTHTGEKPHICPTDGCGKSFSRMENLKIHMRCHTGERPYKCPYEGCGKSYSNSSDRFKHTKTHYEKKPYRCKYEGCQKSYTDPSSLRKHHKSHSTKVALSLYVQSSASTL